uniref:ATP-grasp fold PylC-type domain-containing protein n=1 Tax=viral metagenome TaxID=1070528 RepID=A0A6C0BD45_9ZZZZ
MSNKKYMIIIFGNHSNDWMEAFSELESENLIHVKSFREVLKFKDLDNYLIIPLVEKEIQLLFRFKNNLQSSFCGFYNFKCKYKFSQYVKKNQLQDFCPLYFNYGNIQYPCVSKPFNLSNGKSVEIHYKPFNTEDNKVIQEYIPSPQEYVSHIVSKNGVIIECITYMYTPLNPQLNGHYINNCNLIKEVTKVDIHFKSIFEKFLKPVLYTGVCNIDYKIVNGLPKIFEINPRLGGSLMRKSFREDLKKIISALVESYTL